MTDSRGLNRLLSCEDKIYSGDRGNEFAICIHSRIPSQACEEVDVAVPEGVEPGSLFFYGAGTP